jgi:hypothetical protein
LIHYGIGLHVISDIISGYFDVFKDRGHPGKLGLQITWDVKIEFQSTKQLLVHDGGQYLVLCHGDQTITWSFSIFDKTTQLRVSFDTS